MPGDDKVAGGTRPSGGITQAHPEHHGPPKKRKTGPICAPFFGEAPLKTQTANI